MTIAPYIINDIPIQSVHNKMGVVQTLFNTHPQSHVPVEKDGVFLGCISENDVRSFDKDETIEDHQYAVERFFVGEGDYWLGVLEVFARNKSTLMPVLNEDNQYIGYVELNDVIGLFNIVPFLYEPGGTVVLEKGFKDYSFSEISQIVESNEGKVLGIFVSGLEHDVARITLKINASGMNEIIQSFRRYGYNVVSDHQEDSFRQNLKERSEYLKKYLDI